MVIYKLFTKMKSECTFRYIKNIIGWMGRPELKEHGVPLCHPVSEPDTVEQVIDCPCLQYCSWLYCVIKKYMNCTVSCNVDYGYGKRTQRGASNRRYSAFCKQRRKKASCKHIQLNLNFLIWLIFKFSSLWLLFKYKIYFN